MFPTPPPCRRPDLLDYRLVHRAMTVDFERLATAAEELASRPDRARLAELRRNLGAVTGEVVSHHHVEDAHVWPALIELAADHERLDPLTADQLARADHQVSQLAATLRQVAHLLALFEPRFHRRQQRLFRTGGLSRGTVTRGAAFCALAPQIADKEGRSAAAVESLQIGQLNVGPLPSHAPELGRESAPAHQ